MTNKLLSIAIFVVLGLCVQAQTISVSSVEQIKLPAGSTAYYPQFSPAGDFLIFSASNYAGLHMYDFATRKTSVLTTDAGAGYNTQISADGTSILYSKTELIQNLRHNSLVQLDRATQTVKKITTPQRTGLTARFAANKPTFVQAGKLQAKNINAIDQKPIITIEDRKMVLYNGAIRKILTPNGASESYIWPVFSPDGKKIAYTVVGKNTYVCALNGTNVVSLGYLNAPQWLNNNWLIGMNDIDDGEKTISSELMAVRVDGKVRQKIATPAGKMALYPAASADGKKIAFSTDKGELYLLSVTVK